MEKRKFGDFINEVLSEGYDWFFDLYYPSPTEGEHDPELLKLWENPRDTKEGREAIERKTTHRIQCVNDWMGELMVHAGKQEYRFIKVTELRRDFSCRYYILLGGCRSSGINDRDWHQRWREMSGGYAYERELDERIGGLLHFFVMRLGCPIEIGEVESSRIYDASEFYRWQPKDS